LSDILATMDMDLTGHNPSNKDGEYFRANVSSWVPIHDLTFKLCSDLLDEKTLKGMASNDGTGPNDQETCTEMANRFSHWMEHNADGHSVVLGAYVEKGTNKFVLAEDVDANSDAELNTAYHVHDEHLKKFIEFLRHCGGFEVN